MGRKQLSSDQKKRVRSFSLGTRHAALIATFAERRDISESDALRKLLDLAEVHLNQSDRDLAARRRSAIRLEAIQEERRRAAPEPQISWPGECPRCGDSSNIVRFPTGRWECNLCATSGHVELQPA